MEFIGRQLHKILYPSGVNPLDRNVVVSILLLKVCNGISITLVYSFLPQMIRDLGFSEVDVGTHVGIVASSVYIGRLVGSGFWGALADTIGRRKTLLLSTLLTALFTLMFGLSYNFIWATITRFIQGMVNGTVVACRVAMSDISDHTNQGLALSVIANGHMLSYLIGPALGGFLSVPHEHYPDVFGKESLFGRFPYLLPNVISTIASVVCSVLVFFILPETLKRKKKAEEHQSISETEELIDGRKNCYSSFTSSKIKIKNKDGKLAPLILSIHDYQNMSDVFTVYSLQNQAEELKRNDQDEIEIRTPLPGNKTENEDLLAFQLTLSEFQNNKSGRLLDCCFSYIANCSMKNLSLIKLLRVYEVTLCLTFLALYTFCTVSFMEVIIVYTSTPRDYDGLSFTTYHLGIFLLSQTVPILLGSVLLLPRVQRTFGIKKTTAFATYVLIFLYPIVPCCSKIPESAWVPIVVFVVVCCIRIASQAIFIGGAVMLNNTVEQELLGKVNGLTVSINAIFRGLGPSVSGRLFSWSLKNRSLGFPLNYNFVFLFLALVVLIYLILIAVIPPRLEKRQADELQL